MAGPEWIMAGAALLSTGAQVYSMQQQFDAAGEARRIGALNAEATLRESRENLRRQTLQDEESNALLRARMAASGIAAESETAQLYYGKIQEEQQRERDWMIEAAQSKANIERQGGVYQGKVGEAGAWGSGAEALKGLGTAYNWWSQA